MRQGGILIAGLQYFDSWTLDLTSQPGGQSGQMRDWTLVASFRNIMFFSKFEGIQEKGKACQSHARYTRAGQSLFMRGVFLVSEPSFSLAP